METPWILGVVGGGEADDADTVFMHQRVVYSNISYKVWQLTLPTWSHGLLMLYILSYLAVHFCIWRVYMTVIILKYYTLCMIVSENGCVHISVQTISINIWTLVPQNILPLKCWRDFSCHLPQWVMYCICLISDIHYFVHIFFVVFY